MSRGLKFVWMISLASVLGSLIQGTSGAVSVSTEIMGLQTEMRKVKSVTDNIHVDLKKVKESTTGLQNDMKKIHADLKALKMSIAELELFMKSTLMANIEGFKNQLRNPSTGSNSSNTGTSRGQSV